ncbi:MAG TPA: hypothetical protein DCZ92_10250 [Elusimicrobia bacterium]|nr:hypothetical protein [Elusimicrobiota bacterium]
MKNTNTTNNRAVLLARVSSKKQQEGYSLDFQVKAGKEYAIKKGFIITRTFSITESASKDEREEWDKFIHHIETAGETNILIAKVDRALRNFRDLARIADLANHQGKVFHFFNDGLIYHKDSPATELFSLGIQGSMSTFYSADLSEKTKRGLQEKREQGEMPGRAPIGYKNNKETKKIEVDPVMAPWVKRIFVLASARLYSLRTIVEMLAKEGCQKKLYASNIEYMIRRPFYHGEFPDKRTGRIYPGTHTPLVSRELQAAAIAGLERFNKPKYRDVDSTFLYRGLITCGTCNRTVFGEDKKKGRYRFYHCSGRPPHTKIDYVPESAMAREMERVIKTIQLAPEVITFVMKRLEKDSASEMTAKNIQLANLKAELTRIEKRSQSALDDYYDPSTPEAAKMAINAKLSDWRADKERHEASIRTLEALTPDRYMATLRNMLELSKRAFSLYGKMEPEKKREFLNLLCSNYILREKMLYPIYKKPFDILVKGSSVQIGSGTRIRT